MIERNIYLSSQRRIEQIGVVYGSNLGIKLNLRDEELPANATAVAYAYGNKNGEIYSNPCSVSGNTITLIPQAGFFSPGKNDLQIDVTSGSKHLISFHIPVICETELASGGSVAPTAIKTYAEIAEVAASAAQVAETNVSALEREFRADFGTLPEQVSGLNDYVLPAQVYSGTKNFVASSTQYIDDFEFEKDKTYVIEYNTARSVTIGSYPASQGGSITLSAASKTAEFTPSATGRPFLYSSFDGSVTLVIKVKKDISLVDDMETATADIEKAKEDINNLKETLIAEIVVGSGTFQCEKQVAKKLGFALESGTEYTIRYNASAPCNFWANTASTGGYVVLNGTGETKYTPTASGEAQAYFTSVAGTLEIEVVILNNEAIPTKINEINERLDTISPKEYTVGIGGDYATLTDAFNDLADDAAWKTLKIKGGTYDIYEELGGAAWLSTLTGSENWYDVSTFVPINTKLIGVGMVTLNFNLPDTTPSAVAGLLSCLNVAGSVYMENITINCDNCRYGIHDEYVARYGTNANTSHIFKNVTIDKKRTATGSSMAFGCGQNENEQFLFEDCVFIHAPSGSAQGLLLHNRYANDNTVVIIRNSVMQGYYAGVKFGNVVDGSHIRVTISNSIVKGTLHDVICEKQSTTSPATSNVYDITLIKCGDAKIENTVGAGYEGNIWR